MSPITKKVETLKSKSKKYDAADYGIVVGTSLLDKKSGFVNFKPRLNTK